MRCLLFVDIETTRLDQSTDRITQLRAKLVTPTGEELQSWSVSPAKEPPFRNSRPGEKVATAIMTPISSETLVLGELARIIDRCDLIIGHDIQHTLSVVMAAAARCGYDQLIAQLTPPHFGFDLGRRAAICTRQLATELLTHSNLPADRPRTDLAALHRRFTRFQMPDPKLMDPSARLQACHWLYRYTQNFQRTHNLYFQTDILCMEE